MNLRQPGVVTLGVLLAAFGVAFILVGSGLEVAEWPALFLRDFGIAFLVSALLALTFEGAVRTRLVSDILESTRRRVLEDTVRSPLIREQIDQSLIAKACVRRDYRLTMTLKRRADGRIAVTYSAEYDLVNLSDQAVRYHMFTYVEKRIDPENSNILRLRVDGLADLTGQEIPVDDSDPLVKKLIHPLDLGPRQQLRIRVEYEEVRHDRDYFVWNMTDSTERFFLHVTSPEDMVVEAVPLHPDRDSFRDEHTGNTVNEWAIETGLLPYQGIEVRWRPTTTVTDADD